MVGLPHVGSASVVQCGSGVSKLLLSCCYEVVEMILRQSSFFNSNNVALFGRALTASLMLAGSHAQAADLLPQARIDASGTGTVPVAAPMKAGYSKFTLHGESTPHESAQDVASYGGLDRSNRFDVLAGTSLAKGLDLHLGVHGTYERDGQISSRRVSSGSLMLKTNIISAGGFNLALAPYFESGIGTKGKEVETRAVRGRGGLMLLAGYNRKNVFEWNLAVGNRNRATEKFDGVSFGHESVYKTSLKVNVTNGFGLTAAADGRQIQVDDNKSVFGTGRGQAGFFARFGNVETSVYGGASIDRALGKKLWKPKRDIAELDGGRLFFGAAVSLSIGASKSANDNEPAQDFDHNAVETQARVRGGKMQVPAVIPGVGSAARESTEPVSYENDFLKDFAGYTSGTGRSDDFSSAEATLKSQSVAQPGAYDINAVEREIAQLRAAESKADEARRKADEARLESERKQNAKTNSERAKLMRKMRKEVQADVDALPSITTEDVSWHGLE